MPKTDDRRAIWLLIGLLFVMPFPLGANRPAIWWLFEMAFMLLAAWIPLRRVELMRRVAASGDAFRWLLPACILWLVLQLALGLFAPGVDLNPNALVEAELLALTGFCVLFVSFMLFRSSDDIRYFAWMLIVLGGAQALIGLLTYNDLSLGIWGGRPDYFFAAKGTYPNYNHFAGLLEMCLPFGVVTLVRQFVDGRLFISFRGLASIAAVLLMLAALVMSGSRAGVMAFFVASALVAPLLARAYRQRHAARAGGRRWLVLAGVVVLLSLAVALFQGDLLYRLATRGSNSIRPALWGDMIVAFHQHPWLGNGAGVFADIAPMYKSWLLSVLDFRYAHNDYLSWLIENGLPMTLLLLLIVGYPVWRLVRYLWRGGQPLARWLYGVAALWALLGLGIHGGLDFNFHIPANAALFMAILGIGMSLSHTWRKAPRGRRRRIAPADA